MAAKINENYAAFPKSYLFAEIAGRTREYQAANPGADVIKLGIGDVTRPLPGACAEAMRKAAAELLDEKTFRGYGDYEGYESLRRAISDDYASRGTKIGIDEIFANDGAKADTAGIIDIFGADCRVAVCDPVYPVYVDSNALAGRAGSFDAESGRWSALTYMPCGEAGGFVPEIPKGRADLIYLCFPNNPTGAMITKGELQNWVDYANANGSVILYDAAYEAYITGRDLPRSIYECAGAQACAIEFKSFSKNAGFTGVRSGYTVIPKALKIEGHELNALWMRRQSVKYNGASYITQMGAMASFSVEGRAQIAEILEYYRGNAKAISAGLREAGLKVFGGENAPYIWVKTPGKMTSWEFFDWMLHHPQVVGTPGSGFGPSGEGYFRLTAFASRENTARAVERIKASLSRL
jgi:LL-diaminopimelate aminotransferase